MSVKLGQDCRDDIVDSKKSAIKEFKLPWNYATAKFGTWKRWCVIRLQALTDLCSSFGQSSCGCWEQLLIKATWKTFLCFRQGRDRKEHGNRDKRSGQPVVKFILGFAPDYQMKTDWACVCACACAFGVLKKIQNQPVGCGYRCKPVLLGVGKVFNHKRSVKHGFVFRFSLIWLLSGVTCCPLLDYSELALKYLFQRRLQRYVTV